MQEIGKRLKGFRLTNGMTLKQLASKAGCTDAYLSQIERGRVNPSITALMKIAQALEVKVVDFFLESEHEENDVVLGEKERVDISFKEGDARIQMLVRNIRNKRMQPFYTTLEPGGGSKGAYAHIGEECGIVLKGRLEINLNGKIYLVRKNESFYFSSQEPHSWHNPGKTRAVVIWVVSPPTF